ncbi:ATP-binding protein [Myxococcus sp. MxC21-1]|uniref:sensor histidine kinase n=1 Tax=Myxococcus sp. MxC21-1 TaxID=3041439 RepID=UPI00293029FB|nr:ATP-binding protein [Myxococcus sp. MxC21-1]WNZ62610.1 ATP-binding protein [Myxococcus sp. MxC21-1]
MAMPHLRHRARVEKRLGPVPTVMAHETRLGQVFLQLLVNAAQAIPEGDVARYQVTLSTWRDGATVVVEVADNGHGMAPEVLERAFEPFFTTRPLGRALDSACPPAWAWCEAWGRAVGLERAGAGQCLPGAAAHHRRGRANRAGGGGQGPSRAEAGAGGG